MLEQVEWGEFELGTLFEKLNLKFLKKSFSKSDDVSKEKTAEFDLPLVNAKDGDNGIMYYGRSSDFEGVEMTIDIVNDGAVSTGNVYPQPQKTGVLYNAYLIKPLFSTNNRILFFFSTTIQKSIKLKYGYQNKAGREKVKKEKIYLPIKNGNIDFDFINKFTAKLETEHQAELEVYLKTTGLENYKLTSDELKVLKEFEEGKIEWKEFEIGKLFEIDHYGKQRAQEDLQREGTPKYFFVMQNENNNGVVEKVPEQRGNHFNLIPGNSISAFTHLNKVYYQEYPFYSKQGSNVYTLRSGFLDKQNAKFIISVINKRIGEIGYGKNTASRLASYKIQLPIKNNQLDYEFIGNFISAVEKLVIKDVVMYNKERLKATTEIINN